MPAELWNDAGRMLGCGLTVAAVVAPVGLISWWAARRATQPIVPHLRPWRVKWTGLEVIFAFLVLNVVVPMLVFNALAQSDFFPTIYGAELPTSATFPVASLESSAAIGGAASAIVVRDHLMEWAVIRGLWAGLLSLPFQIGLLILVGQFLGRPRQGPTSWAVLPARMSLAILAWAALTPLVLAIHALVNIVFTELQWQSEDHPLSKLSAARPTLDHILFFLQAGIAAPIIEEVLFRGVLLGWLVGGRSLVDMSRIGLGRHTLSDRGVWSVFILAVVFAILQPRHQGQVVADFTSGPVLFAAGLAIGWILLRSVLRKRRTIGAVYASAALFAVVHSAVWPSPIPLFALGLGLGWLAVRTRGVVAPIIVHGLFNTISVLFVLRSG